MISGEYKERLTNKIIEEHNLRSINTKEKMLDHIEAFLKGYLSLPEGIVKFQRDEKQMSYQIFDQYICFDYPGNKIEVRYTPMNKEEIYVGSIIVKEGYTKPSWKNYENELSEFDMSTLDRFMEIGFSFN